MASNVDVLLLDTSAAIALVDESNGFHEAVNAATRGKALGLSGHACFETYSVLTRLPYPARLSGMDAARLIAAEFPETVYLDGSAADQLVSHFASGGIIGGAVFDGLVGACAKTHGLTLLSCDSRAKSTYEVLGVAYRLVAA
ncbi:MAG: type II toxin-antitoxin system VapC family toxin [Promicromonosporaceae bacterium]|nr:type II toxin-antitoxin system VapC family toxin [Promicromonosporaceae bacterium]